MFGQKLAWCAILLNGLAFGAPSINPSLTILLRFEHPGSVVSTEAMKSEVRYLLGRDMSVRFGTDSDAVQATSGRLVIFRMRGYCSMNHSVESQRPGSALGSTFVSDGVVLPFGQVECDRIRASLQRINPFIPHDSQQQLGQAMGRVLVHEIYHMLSGSSAHTSYGITKRALSPFELSATTADLPRDSKHAMETLSAAESK